MGSYALDLRKRITEAPVEERRNKRAAVRRFGADWWRADCRFERSNAKKFISTPHQGSRQRLDGEEIRATVVVPVLNEASALPGLFEALAQQTLSPSAYEVVVVDNGSTDDTIAIVEKQTNVRLLRNAHLEGDAVRAVGVNVAQAPVIAFTDADCRPAPDWLECGLQEMLNQQVKILAGAVCFTPEVAMRSIAELADSFMSIQQEKMVLMGWGACANLFVHHEVFCKVGTFLS